MFIMENIINSATRGVDDKKHIIIVNEQCDEEIRRLCSIDHEFYIFTDKSVAAWGSKETPRNLTVTGNMYIANRRFYDFVLCVNRAKAYNKAYKLSESLHLPLIILDIADMETGVPMPLYSVISAENRQEVYSRSGVCSVGISKDITDSWVDGRTGLNVTIPWYSKPIAENGTKILLDNKLPKQFYDKMEINLNNSTFTFNHNDAKAYIHLWQHITPLFMDCINSKIPIVVFDQKWTKDFKVNVLKDPRELKSLAGLNLQMPDPKPYSEQNFINSWDNVFRSLTNHCFLRD